MSNDLMQAALASVRAGVSIIPIDHNTKRPAMHLLPKGEDGKATWKPYQQRIADEATVRRWFVAGAQAFAVVTGNVSGGLLVLDFDASGFVERWADTVGELTSGLPVQQTGGGGYQVLFRCPNPGGNNKLAWKLDETEQTGRTIAIETRGEGGYAVVAPSMHPSGNQYKWLGELTAADVPGVTQAHAEQLLAAARALDEAPMTVQERERVEAKARAVHQRRQQALNGHASVIQAFNAAHSIECLLQRHGYTHGHGGRYVRPGGKSESVSVKDGRSYHWSSNDPLNDGNAHDSFDVFTRFEHGDDVSAAVKAAAEPLGMKRTSAEPTTREPWPKPLPLPAGLPPVPTFDYEILPTPFRAWVTDIAERMQCPVDYLAVTAMVAAATLIGRKVVIRPKQHDDWQVVVNLFGLCVGRPSLMKSPAIQEALNFLTGLEIKAKKQHAEALAEHEAGKVIAEATRKVNAEKLKKAIKDGTDATELAAALTKDEEAEPARQRYLVNNTTVEKLGVILNENPNGVLIYCDEVIGWLKTLDRDGHEGDRAFYLTAWSGDKRYTYDRIGRGTLDIEAAVVSFIGAIQPGVLHDYLQQAIRGGAGDDGLVQRFQLAVWPDVPACWVNIDRWPNPQARQQAYDAFQRLADLKPGLIEAERDNYDSNALPFLRFDHDAQQLFYEWRGNLEKCLRSGADHPAIEAHLAKYRSLVPSLALIIQLVEGGTGPVSKAALEKAIRWAAYLECHARRLYAGVTEAAAVAARELARRILRGDVADGFTARDVYRNGWTSLDREQTQAAIDVLLSLHWLDERIEDTAGRPKTRYVINPKVRDSQRAEPTELTKASSVGFVSAGPQAVAVFSVGEF